MGKPALRICENQMYNYRVSSLSSISYNVQHMKSALMQFADKVGPDQRAHLCSLIWTLDIYYLFVNIYYSIHWSC